MNIIGIKPTHDGTIAVIKNGCLLVSVEVEKVDNGPRYASISDRSLLDRMLYEALSLAYRGVVPSAVNCKLVVDGWVNKRSRRYVLDMAPYNDGVSKQDPMTPFWYSTEQHRGHLLRNLANEYVSYHHTTDHVTGTYLCWPGAVDNKDDTYVLVWDGTPGARLYVINPVNRKVTFIAQILSFAGYIYGALGLYFGPYRLSDSPDEVRDEIELIRITTNRAAKGDREFPGKLMAYIGLGTRNNIALEATHSLYQQMQREGKLLPEWEIDGEDPLAEKVMHEFMFRFARLMKDCGLDDPSALLTYHRFIEELMIDGLKLVMTEGENLLFTGGCALNIKWNSALRNCGHFNDVWVPPFPNDTGSALGAAATEAWLSDGINALDWTVFCGPRLKGVGLGYPGWVTKPDTISDVARRLADFPEEPILFLVGRSEIGPRALGQRSILASVNSKEMKSVLNRMKRREEFRPVSPICLEEEAPDWFSPGTPDPYMLFEHMAIARKAASIPAVVHIDGSARLQTVGRGIDSSPIVRGLLEEYNRLTGIPMLCNTSANYNGSGFFPDVASALLWARGAGIRYVYTDNDERGSDHISMAYQLVEGWTPRVNEARK
jgi:carbamoyltransferase